MRAQDIVGELRVRGREAGIATGYVIAERECGVESVVDAVRHEQTP